jgi:hypothetical protein
VDDQGFFGITYNQVNPIIFEIKVQKPLIEAKKTGITILFK